MAQATFPLPPDTRAVDKVPYRSNARTSSVIYKCFHDMLGEGIIEKRPSPWGSLITVVAEENGSPRFSVDYCHTLNRHLCRRAGLYPTSKPA